MKIYIIALSLFTGWRVVAQDTLYLLNPSFEMDRQFPGQIPMFWRDLGNPSETPTDIQPGSFEVTKRAQAGSYYVGMVTRENNTWEGIAQQLNGKLAKDSTYKFGLWLATAPHYRAVSRVTGELADYNQPVMLKIWGVNTTTKAEELLAETEPVLHASWLQYVFTLQPGGSDYDEIQLLVYYAKGFMRTNGNLLIDNCSPIVKTK